MSDKDDREDMSSESVDKPSPCIFANKFLLEEPFLVGVGVGVALEG
jgi:hypothetical protein